MDSSSNLELCISVLWLERSLGGDETSSSHFSWICSEAEMASPPLVLRSRLAKKPDPAAATVAANRTCHIVISEEEEEEGIFRERESV